MKIQKPIKKIVIILICFSGVALAGLNIIQNRQIQKATQAMSPAAQTENESKAGLTPGNKSAMLEDESQNPPVTPGSRTGENEADELMYQIGAAEEELSMVNDQLEAEEAKKAERKEIQKELQKKYRENPSFKASMKKSLDTQYADLFKKLDLSPEKAEMFKDLLFEEQMAQQEIFMDYGDTGDLSKEQQEELNARYQALHEEYESKKEELLGERGFETYQAYTETEYERYRVNDFIKSLGSGESLTESQKESLIEAMHEEGQYIVYETPDDDEEASSNGIDEKYIERALTNQDRRTEAYVKAAGSILSASQIEKLEEYLENGREQLKIILEMQALRNGTSRTAQTGTDE